MRTCIERDAASVTFPVRDYDLAARSSPGRRFRWRGVTGGWNGVIHNRWVRLRADEFSITAEASAAGFGLDWLADYLQSFDFHAVVTTFPDDEPIVPAVMPARMRLLRQEPWNASLVILSSTKQIVQIRQIVSLLANDSANSSPPGRPTRRSLGFPPLRLARATEAECAPAKSISRALPSFETARSAEGRIDPGKSCASCRSKCAR